MEGRSEEHARRAARAIRAAARLAPADAAALFEEAIGESGPLPCLVTPFAEALESLGRDEALIALCQRVLDAGVDLRERPIWKLRLAEACERHGDVAAAVTAHRAVLDATPRERRSLRALQRIHRAEGDNAPLVRALESELALCAGQEEVALRLELAALLSGPLARGMDALLHLRRALDLEPARDGVLDRALALASSLGAASDQVAILDVALARAETPSARARLLARQAALLAGPLASPSQAVARWQEAIAVEPSLPGVREPLRCALERLGDWSTLLDCLLEEARGSGPEARRTLLERGAAVAAERFGPDAALPWLVRMRAEAPNDPTVVERLAELHRCAGRQEALRSALDTLATLPILPARAAALARERAGCAPGHARALPDTRLVEPPPRPSAPIRKAVEPKAYDAGLPALGGEDFLQEARLAEAELAGLDPLAKVYAERRRVLECRLARLYAGPLSDPELALPFLRAVAATPPDARDAPGLESERVWAEERLLELLRDEGSFMELETRLSTRLARFPDDSEGWLELAGLREEALHAPAAAADAYREALRRAADPRRALAGLRRSARTLGDWQEVARTLEAELDVEHAQREPGTPSQLRRAELLRELGEVAWHRLGATTRASRAFAGVLEADPRDLVSLRSLRALLASMEDWRGALDLVESEIELLPPGDRLSRRALWLEAADIAASRVDDLERALRAFDAAEALAPLETSERRRLAKLLHRSGDLERYVAVAGPLLEHAPVDDTEEWLRLGHACLALGRLDAARQNAKCAVRSAPEREAAWELLAEVELAQGQNSEAAECLLRAADSSGPARAVARLLRAARIVAPLDAEFAHGLRESACARDPGNAEAWLERARSAAGLGRSEEAEDAAIQSAELAAAAPATVALEPLLETALEAAYGARAGGRLGAAARILAALRGVAPESTEVLRAQALVLRAGGDTVGALHAATALFTADPGAAKDPLLVVVLAEGLAEKGLLEEAAERFAEATSADPSLEPAWAGLTQCLETSGRTEAAIAALEAWALEAAPARNIQCRLRAAELAWRCGDRGPAPEARLRKLLDEHPGCTRGAELLALNLLERGCPLEVCGVVEAAHRHRRPGDPAAALERLKAHALETLGRIAEACDAWASVLSEDPAAADAAQARAALLRGRALWQEAAATLEALLDGAPGLSPEIAAQTWLDLAALRAGPLGDREGATFACREAVRACPAHRAAREALADALSCEPGTREEAVARHLELLEGTPERVASLRALVDLAASMGAAEAARDGRAILRALDAGEPDAPLRVGFRSATHALENTVWERARRLAQALSRELARALGASRTLEPPPTGEGILAFRLSAVVAEAELAAAALVPLHDEEAHAVLATAAVLAAERSVVSGDGRLVNALAEALGRRARRRAREVLGDTAPEEIAEIDAASWRGALRALSYAVALDANGGDLRAALLALLDDGEGDGGQGSSEGIRERVASHPVARELLRRAVLAWGRTLLPPTEPR